MKLYLSLNVFSNINQTVRWLFIIQMVVLSIQSVEGQVQTRIIKNGNFNTLRGAHFIDGKSKLFATANIGDGYKIANPFVIEYGEEAPGPETFHLYNPETSQFITKARDLIVMGLTDGSSVLAVDRFECDLVTRDIVKVNDGGTVEWHYKVGFIFENDPILHIGLSQPDVIAVEFSDSTLCLDLDGNRVDCDPNYSNIYNPVIAFGNEFIGAVGSEAILLDSFFNILDEITEMPDSIRSIEVFEEKKLLIVSSEMIQVIDSHFQVLYTNTSIPGVRTAIPIGNRIYTANDEGLFRLDSTLQQLAFYASDSYETIEYLSRNDNDLVVWSHYEIYLHKDIVMRQMSPENINITSTYDVGIKGLTFPDELVKQYTDRCWFNYILHFDFVEIEVENKTDDTIYSFDLETSLFHVGNCSIFKRVWHIDSVLLLPNSTLDVRLDSFSTDCIQSIIEMCFWITAPNQNTDINGFNDLECAHLHIINSLTDIQEQPQINIAPNPTSGQVSILSPQADKVFEVKIFDRIGLLKRTDVLIEKLEIDCSEWNSGLYYVLFRSKDGSTVTRKLTVTN